MHVSLMHHHRERFYYYHYQIRGTINSNLINDQIVLKQNSIRRGTFPFLFYPLFVLQIDRRQTNITSMR